MSPKITEQKQRMKNRFKNLSITSQMLIGYILPIAALVLMLVVLFFVSMYGQNADHIYNSCNASMTQVDYLVSEYITQADRTLMNAYSDKEVLGYLRTVARSEMYSEGLPDELDSSALYTSLNGLLNLNADLYSVSVIDASERAYTVCKSGRPLETPEFSDAYYDPLRESYGEMILLSKTNRKNVISDEREVFTIGRKLVDTGTSSSIYGFVGYIVVECETDTLRELIDALNIDKTFRFQVSIGDDVLYTSSDDVSIGAQTVETYREMDDNERQNPGFFKEMVLYKESTNGYIAGTVGADAVLRQMSPVLAQFMAFLIGSILVVLVISVIISRKIVAPIRALEKAMTSFESPDEKIEMQPVGGNEFAHLHDTFNKMVLRLNNQSKNLMELSQQNKEVQLKALYSQIKPHFLYNTLESIRMLAVMKENEKVAEAVKALGDIFRYSTANKEDVVQVADEVKHMTDYFRLQKLSFGDRIELLCDMEDSVMDGRILRFVLQPLVENAIKHGLAKTRRDGLIRVSARAEGDSLVFEVSDNGVGMSPEKVAAVCAGETETSREGIGLSNINMRLKLLFGEQLEIVSQPGVGTTVRFTVPQK